MSLADAFGPADAHYRRQIMHETWGHLAPVPRKTHKGYILFAYGEYGDVVPIRSHFKDLSDSPWFFDAMTNFLCKRAKTRGRIYRFEGAVMMCKNGKFKFSGKTKTVRTV